MRVLKFLFNLFVIASLVLGVFFLSVVGLAMWGGPKIAPKLVGDFLEGKTGFSAKIKKVDPKYFKGDLGVSDIVVMNPAYYPYKDFVNMRLIYAEVDWYSLLKEEIVIKNVSIDVAKLMVIRTKDGSINVMEFADGFKDSKEKNTTVEVKEAGDVTQVEAKAKKPGIFDRAPFKKSGFVIKTLLVSLDKVEIYGFPGAMDEVRTFDINYSRTFTDVRDFDNVSEAIAEDLKEYGINALAQALLEEPMSALMDTVDEAVNKNLQKGLRKVLPNKVADPLGDVLDRGLGLGKETTKGIEKGLKKLFK